MKLLTLSTRTIAACLAATINFLAASSEAVATYSDSDFFYYSTVSDPGATIGPLVLGEDIGVNGCSSTFLGFSLCQFSDLSAFTFEWTLWDSQNNSYAVMSSFSGANAANGLETEFATGAGTYFQATGTYFIGLDIFLSSNTYVGLPNGQSVYTRQYGARGFQWGNSFEIAEALPVPEPAGFLLLLPAFALIARRERRVKAR